MGRNGRFLLHVVTKSHRGSYGAGHWKDIASFNKLLGQVGLEFGLVEFEPTEFGDLVKRCRVEGVTDIIWYYSFWPELLQRLRSELPNIRLFVRAVNAEALQHWQRSGVNLVPSYRNLRAIYGTIRLAWRDSSCCRYSEGILGISSWDNSHYWNRLPGRARIYDVPYVPPWPFLRPSVSPMPWKERKKAIVCLAGGRFRFDRTIIQGFSIMADSLVEYSGFKSWKFLLSPGVHPAESNLKFSEHIEELASLDEPWDLLCGVRSVAVLTPLGFGVKTTIFDGLAAGCHVLVHPTIAKRLPLKVREKCVVLDPTSLPDVNTILQLLEIRPDTSSVNELLQQLACASLHQAFPCD
jgi:hypothetical protein